MDRRQIRFSGRVQGVGFRATARHLAAGHSITGWVRNEADGGVLAEVQGNPSEIDRFLNTLRERMGPLIRGETAAACRIVEGESGFEVRH